jgi:hypothetical protein
MEWNLLTEYIHTLEVEAIVVAAPRVTEPLLLQPDGLLVALQPPLNRRNCARRGGEPVPMTSLAPTRGEHPPQGQPRLAL